MPVISRGRLDSRFTETRRHFVGLKVMNKGYLKRKIQITRINQGKLNNVLDYKNPKHNYTRCEIDEIMQKIITRHNYRLKRCNYKGL